MAQMKTQLGTLLGAQSSSLFEAPLLDAKGLVCVCVDHLKRCKTSNLLDDVLRWFSNLTLPFWLFHLIFQQKQGGKAFSDYLAQRSYVTEGGSNWGRPVVYLQIVF